jgi:hypothetical protein
MNITINLLEAASELAHEVVCAKFEDDDNAIYESTTDTITARVSSHIRQVQRRIGIKLPTMRSNEKAMRSNRIYFQIRFKCHTLQP